MTWIFDFTWMGYHVSSYIVFSVIKIRIDLSSPSNPHLTLIWVRCLQIWSYCKLDSLQYPPVKVTLSILLSSPQLPSKQYLVMKHLAKTLSEVAVLTNKPLKSFVIASYVSARSLLIFLNYLSQTVVPSGGEGVVSFRGQKKLGPLPDRSPLGV